MTPRKTLEERCLDRNIGEPCHLHNHIRAEYDLLARLVWEMKELSDISDHDALNDVLALIRELKR